MKTLALGLALLAGGAGCMHFEPVGPFANQLAGGGGNRVGPAGPGPATEVAPGVRVTAAKDAGAMPLATTAPPPSPPALLVTPADVTEAAPDQAARRLTDELETDRRGMDEMPRYPEVSYVNRK